jgi:23S rRNA pseudouridine2605 synthase
MAKKTSKTKKTNDLQAETAVTELITPELEAAPTPQIEAAVEAAPQAEAAATAEAPEAKKEPKVKKAKPKPKAKAKAKAEPAAEVVPEAEAVSEPEAEESAEEPSEAADEAEDNSESADDAEAEFEAKPRPPAKLERLQKILAQAGIASRRHAEEMIEQGRVQVNGKIVTVLGTKADAGRDHIRVDGKLLQGNERLRYFVLNKPKGFVTTVKDPEGRPTVMQFFEKMKERLYPVGRLDYQSEGLLLVTNDGELANKLTKAGSGVEKTYLVKVAGQPTEDELSILRGGVMIERGKPGSPQVRTSPARIRQVRQGDNPWYEVVLIEGRNRELRKMFESVGHFVEKIRRVGYGPLVLDQEPGNLRELQADELELLRKAAEGKLRTPKSKELRRRNAADAAQLPTVMPKPSRPRPAKPFASKPFGEAAERSAGHGPARSEERPRRTTGAGTSRFGSARPASREFDRSDARPASRSTRPPSRFAPAPSGEGRPFSPKPAWKKPERPAFNRPAGRFTPGAAGESRPGEFRPRAESSRPGSERMGRTGSARPFNAKPAWNKPDRPTYNRPPSPRSEAPDSDEDFGPVRPPNLHIEEISQWDRPTSSRPSAPRSYSDRPRPSRPGFDRPASSGRSSEGAPFRGKGGLARPFTTSSGKPRPGGARLSSKPGAPAGRSSTRWKPGKPGGRSYGPGAGVRSGSGSIEARTGSGYRPAPGGRGSYAPRQATGSGPSGSARPYTPRTEGASDYRPTKARPYSPSTPRAERKAGSDWKPKTGAGGFGKSYGGSNSKPRPGGFSKSGFKGKSAGFGGKRTGSRPGGKKRG